MKHVAVCMACALWSNDTVMFCARLLTHIHAVHGWSCKTSTYMYVTHDCVWQTPYCVAWWYVCPHTPQLSTGSRTRGSWHLASYYGILLQSMSLLPYLLASCLLLGSCAWWYPLSLVSKVAQKQVWRMEVDTHMYIRTYICIYVLAKFIATRLFASLPTQH